MKVPVGISRRHVHLTKEIWKCLFGDEEISVRNYINQPGQYASNSTVDLQVDDKIITHVRVVGPLREYNQVELALSDAKELGINPPRRQSNDLDGAGSITIIGPKGSVYLENVVILAEAHIHMESNMIKGLCLTNKEIVDIYQDNKFLFEAKIKETNPGYFECHIDTDEALAYNLSNGDILEFKRK